MLFGQLRELPVATVRRAPRARVGLITGQLRRWMSLRWEWLRPRSVPVIVAMLGMAFVLRSVSYLSHSPEAPEAPGAAEATGALVITRGPHAVTIYVDGNRSASPHAR